MRAERGGPTLWPKTPVNQRWEEPVPEAKPYNIPKQLVLKAYQQVKANRGAAGVDDETLTMFKKDLKGNLYKVWNRMSSGSYFPPPVRLVEIPKDNGGKHPLGTPTVADRVADAGRLTGLSTWISKPSLIRFRMTSSSAPWHTIPTFRGYDCA
jgi:hypothetical protein